MLSPEADNDGFLKREEDIQIKTMGFMNPWIIVIAGIVLAASVFKIENNSLLVPAVGGLFVIVGLNGLIGFVKNMITGKKSRNWPTTKGKIIASEILGLRMFSVIPSYTFNKAIIYTYNVDGTEYVSNRVRIETGGEGQTRSGTTQKTAFGVGKMGPVPLSLNFQGNIRVNLKNQTRKDLNNYKVGDEIQVHYNPKHPKYRKSLANMIFPNPNLGPGGPIHQDYTENRSIGNAILEPGWKFSNVAISFLISIALMIVGIGLFAIYYYGIGNLFALLP